MLRVPVPECEFFEFLDEMKDWCILRNFDVLGNFERGGDCDILALDVGKSYALLIDKLGCPVRVARRSYVMSCYYPWGHVDITNGIYWRGLLLASGDEVERRADKSGRWPVVVESDKVAVLLLNSLLWGGFAKERYRDEVFAAFYNDDGAVKARFTEMIGAKAAELVATHVQARAWLELERIVPELRKLVKRECYSRGAAVSFRGELNFLMKEISLRLGSQIPPLIVRVDGEVGDELHATIRRIGTRYEYLVDIVPWYRAFGVLYLLDLTKRVSFRVRNGVVVYIVERKQKIRRGLNVYSVDLIGDESDESALVDGFSCLQERSGTSVQLS